MNRSLWTQFLTKTYCPPWTCPACGIGTVSLVAKSLVHQETAESRRSRSHDAWDPEWVRYAFTAWAECKHPPCKQQIAISGEGRVEPGYGEEGDFEWDDEFYPKACWPMPDIFVFPEKCPSDVEDEMRAAFALFWGFRTACAGRIRVALECLLNHLGVPKRRKGTKGKFYDLTLHKRIDEYAAKEPTLGPQLMALKWLGNSGSHDAEVSQNDLLDAFEIMEHALHEIIDRRSARVSKLAKALTKRHKH